MIRIAITAAAFDVVAAIHPLHIVVDLGRRFSADELVTFPLCG